MNEEYTTTEATAGAPPTEEPAEVAAGTPAADTTVTEEPAAAAAPTSHGFPCRSCGSRMVFSPADGALACPFCHAKEEIPSPVIEAAEHLYDPEAEVADAPDWEDEGALVHVCPACGAETVSEAESMTVTCPFCGSHYVTEPKPGLPILRPETMVPHALTQEAANALFAKWVKRRYFAPRAFRRATHSPDMQGVYLPYFTFDSDLHTAYSGQGGRRRTVSYTVRVNGKTERRTRTVIDWYPVAGTCTRFFDDAPICASRHVDAKMLSKLGAFSTKTLHVYHPAYLAGFCAERYTLGLSEGFSTVRPQIEGRMQREIESSLGYDTYRMMSYRHTHRKVTFKHLLLPVWLSSYRFHGKIYRFMVNGETGRVAGQAPLSALKIILTVLASIGLLALFIFLFSLLGNEASALMAAPEEAVGLLPPPQ